MAGNPFCKAESDTYKHDLILNIPTLKYLDYVFIDEAQRTASNDDADRINRKTPEEQQKEMELLEKKEQDEARALKETQVILSKAKKLRKYVGLKDVFSG